MLTFKTAPRTLLGPCEHALWHGGVFLTKHHIHMPDGVEEWRAGVNRMMRSAAEHHASDVIATTVNMDTARRIGDRAGYDRAFAMWQAARSALDDIANRYGV